MIIQCILKMFHRNKREYKWHYDVEQKRIIVDGPLDESDLKELSAWWEKRMREMG